MVRRVMGKTREFSTVGHGSRFTQHALLLRTLLL